jgi:hypothetical protein
VLGADAAVLLTASLQLGVWLANDAPQPPASILADFTVYPRNLLANFKVCVASSLKVSL